MLMSANEQPFAVYYPPLRLHTSCNMITCWVKLTKSISTKCVSAEISAAVIGTPTAPPNYTCRLLAEGAGLLPAVKPGCITWITTNWITNWHCCVTLLIQREHIKGYLSQYLNHDSNINMLVVVKLICRNPHCREIQIETLLFRWFEFCELEKPDSVSSTRRHHATAANFILYGYFFQLKKTKQPKVKLRKSW